MDKNWVHALRSLSADDFHEVFWSLYDYQESAGTIELPCTNDRPLVGVMLSLILPQIDNRIAGSKGGIASRNNKKANISPPTIPTTIPTTALKLSQDKLSQDELSGDNNEAPPKATRARTKFTPPSLEEVQAYCTERGNTVDAQRFVDYYASKGWVIGKSPMKDWKAAVRNWERREREQGTTLQTFETDDFVSAALANSYK